MRTGFKRSVRRRTAVAAALMTPPALALVVTSPLAAQHPSLGPVTFEEGAPLQRLGYTPMLEIADPVGDGAVRMDLWMGYSNIFERDSSEVHDVYLDLERYITTATLRYGVSDAVEIGGRFTLEYSGGGFLDAFMVDFHDWFGLGSRNRRYFPYGDYRLTVDDAEGRRRVDIPRHGFALEDVRLFAKWRAYQHGDGHTVLSLRAVTRIPTHTDLVGAERTDVSLMALGRTRWRRWHLHGGIGAATVRSSPELDDLMRGGTWFMWLGVEHPFNDRLSAVVEYVESKPVMEDVGDSDVDGAITNVVFGVVGRAGQGWRWEIAMQEDVPPRGPSLDFQFQVALSKTW